MYIVMLGHRWVNVGRRPVLLMGGSFSVPSSTASTHCTKADMSQAHSTLLLIIIVVQQFVCMSAILGPHGPMVTEVSQLFVYGSRFTKLYHNVPGSAPLRKHLNIFERNCLAVHEQSALWVMGAGLSKGHQGTAYHSPLRHFNIVLS